MVEFSEFTINSSISRIHYLFRKSTIFRESTIYRESTIFERVYYLFRESTMDPLFFPRIHNSFVITPLIHYPCRDSTTDSWSISRIHNSFANTLSINNLFREVTLNSLFILRTDNEITICFFSNAFWNQYFVLLSLNQRLLFWIHCKSILFIAKKLYKTMTSSRLVIMTHTLCGAYCGMLRGEMTLFSNYITITELVVIMLHYYGSFSV